MYIILYISYTDDISNILINQLNKKKFLFYNELVA